MTTLSLPQIEGHDLLTHSRLTCKKTCPRKHYYRYIAGVRPQGTSAPLRLGTAIHIGLDARNKGADENQAIALACEGYPDAMERCQTPEQQHDLAVEQEIVARLLAGYFWRWMIGEADPHIEKIIASEQGFRLPILNPETGRPTPTFEFAGKIDGIVRLRDGRVAVIEHKTAKKIDDAYWARLQIDQQISGYVIAGRQHELVETVLYDVIRKPGIKPRKITKEEAKTWTATGLYFDERILEPVLPGEVETPAMYGARLAADIADNPDKYFVRREIPRLEADLAEFRTELWDMQRDMAESIKHGRHYRNTAACVGFGKCEYLSICANGIDPNNPPSGFVRVTNLHPELLDPDAEQSEGDAE